MGGLLSTLGRAIVGGAQGYGKYLIGEGEKKAKAAEADALMLREEALAKFRQDLGDASDVKRNDLQMKLVSHTAGENRVSNAIEVKNRAAVDAANDARDFEYWKKKNQITYSTWEKQQNVDLSNSKKKILFEAETRARFDADKQGMKPMPGEGDVDEATGTRVLYYQRPDGTVATYDTGVVVQQKQPDNPYGAPTAAPKRQPAKAGWREGGPSSSGDGAPKTLTAAEYESAAASAMKRVQRGEPGWKGLDAAGVRKKLEDLYGAQGYALPQIR